jgi:hypothetical protein
MRHPPSRTVSAVLALCLALGLGAAACSKNSASPAAPATSISPDSSARSDKANTVPPGVSGQGSQGGAGTNGAAP